MVRFAAFLLLAAVLVLPRQATSHPHVWIDAHATLRLEGGTVQALAITWRFDDFFSSMMLEDFAGKGGKAFDAKSQAALRDQVMLPMSEFAFFTHAAANGEKLPITKIEDFRAEIEKGRVIFHFIALLPRSVDPKKEVFSLGLYDESYYVDVQLDKWDPIRFSSADAPGCAVDIAEDTSNPLYYGAFFPKLATLNCVSG
ncbi:MAG: DUF1007 family protein [Alphaproteobacteria bacterium]|nr:DUF1007 family protein [Alphaproteobacteria bacterium]MBU0797874.1 DUF1007 family protein [Alphaproteobacteria bacterium]MBU0886174.1 DUF1007 family protein [Alphaproteobacteria bacterium]MBU1812814.1 DUF1007 family protein [Alphaproteobacteria bacterium]MBU2091181.1 DUF1007 family protein [Alphaproteobacteria bacterium]